MIAELIAETQFIPARYNLVIISQTFVQKNTSDELQRMPYLVEFDTL